MKLTAKVGRDGRYWFVAVPEIKGLFTQARTLAEVPMMVLDAAALLTERPESDFEVEVVPDVPGFDEALRRADELAAEADELRARSAQERRNAARILKDKGLTVRDIGTVLHISHQRAAQLLDAK